MAASAPRIPRASTAPDHRLWRERARSMTPLLRERSAAIEAGRALTADVLDALHERELSRDDPQGLGGGRRDPRSHDGAARPHPARDHPRHHPGDPGLGAGSTASPAPPRSSRTTPSSAGSATPTPSPSRSRGATPTTRRWGGTCSVWRSRRSSCSRASVPCIRSAADGRGGGTRQAARGRSRRSPRPRGSAGRAGRRSSPTPGLSGSRDEWFIRRSKRAFDAARPPATAGYPGWAAGGRDFRMVLSPPADLCRFRAPSI